MGDPETEYSNTTGRFVVDYVLNDNALVYGSISKGFKGGGFNPPLDPAKYPDTPQIFPDTELMAYEVGIKIDFPERGMRLNTSAYMYDASDYQVTKIQNKTRVNEGIDVDMMGIESEFIWVPLNAPQWQINAGISFEESEIASGNMLLNPANADLCLSHWMRKLASHERWLRWRSLCCEERCCNSNMEHVAGRTMGPSTSTYRSSRIPW